MSTFYVAWIMVCGCVKEGEKYLLRISQGRLLQPPWRREPTRTSQGRCRPAAQFWCTLKAHLISNSFYEPTHPSDFKRHLLKVRATERSRSQGGCLSRDAFFFRHKTLLGCSHKAAALMWLFPHRKQDKNTFKTAQKFDDSPILSEIIAC